VSLLVARNLTKSYGGITVLRDVALTVHAGEVHALLGENGAGKSTLIKILTGAVVPDRGELTLNGVRLPFGDALHHRHAGISAVYQEFTLVPELTVADNVFLGREQGRFLVQRSAMRSMARTLFQELGVSIDVTVPVRGLSVAQQQMVEIARALATTASVVIFDEPTAALPGGDVDRFLTVVRRLRDRGLGVVYTSHRLEEVFAIADTMTVLRDGQVVTSGPIGGVQRADLIRWMVGRDISEEFPSRDGIRFGDVVFEAQHVSMPPRVKSVQFQIRRGEVVAMAGLVGAGRTATALGIVGALQPVHGQQGKLLLDGAPVVFRSPVDALRNGVAYVTEDRKNLGLFPALSVEANITVSRLAELARFGWISSGYERPVAERIARDCQVRAASLSQPVATLSGGNQQKVLLARYLLTPPKVLILDEPTRGVDVGARAEIYTLIDRLSRAGLAILLISSDLTEVLGMADRVVVMREGRTIGEVPRAQATAERIMQLATLQ
jgi:ABC-type sugar transport system ATPase subunit